MKNKILLGVQVITGLMLIVFGLDKFFHFMPSFPSPQEFDMFMGALAKTGYMFPLVGAIQFLTGLSFVLNKCVPFMAIIIVPVMLNAVLAHLFLDPSGIMPAAVVLALVFVVLFKNKEIYAPIFKA